MTPPTNIALRIVVEENPALVRQLNAGYADAEADGGLEPDERDALLDTVSRHFLGRAWPRGGGMEATRRFMADLHRALRQAGWMVNVFAVAA